MFASTPNAAVTPASRPPVQSEPVHLLLVRTPSLTPRGRRWLERAQLGAFDGRELQRLIRLEKLSLG